MREAMRAELAKPEPDLVAVAALADEVQAAKTAAQKKVRDEGLQLYATLRVEQKAVVPEFLEQKLKRSEAFRQRMLQRFGEPRD